MNTAPNSNEWGTELHRRVTRSWYPSFDATMTPSHAQEEQAPSVVTEGSAHRCFTEPLTQELKGEPRLTKSIADKEKDFGQTLQTGEEQRRNELFGSHAAIRETPKTPRPKKGETLSCFSRTASVKLPKLIRERDRKIDVRFPKDLKRTM